MSHQPCPDGQSGEAVWKCGDFGEWIDFPDLSNCSKIDISGALDDLKAPESVPSSVIKNLKGNVTQEKDLGKYLDYLSRGRLDRTVFTDYASFGFGSFLSRKKAIKYFRFLKIVI